MRALVLTSGGMDSATCVALAIEKYGKGNVATLSVSYGQTLSRELDSARRLSEHYGLPHREINLAEVFKGSKCSLIAETGGEIVEAPYDEQDDGVITSYVPFRNGLFLSAAASAALSMYGGECVVVLGNHGSDFAYADCSGEFVRKMDDAIREGTYGMVSFWSPLDGMSKAEVAAEGIRLGVPYEMTWSCYEGGERPCGKCGSCIERIRAFEANGAKDPVEYEEA